MPHDGDIGSGKRSHSQELFQTLFLCAIAAMVAQQHQAQRRASRFAATALDQNASDTAVRWALLDVFKSTLHKFAWWRTCAGFDIVAIQEHLSIDPLWSDFQSELGAPTLWSLH